MIDEGQKNEPLDFGVNTNSKVQKQKNRNKRAKNIRKLGDKTYKYTYNTNSSTTQLLNPQSSSSELNKANSTTRNPMKDEFCLEDIMIPVKETKQNNFSNNINFIKDKQGYAYDLHGRNKSDFDFRYSHRSNASEQTNVDSSRK